MRSPTDLAEAMAESPADELDPFPLHTPPEGSIEHPAWREARAAVQAAIREGRTHFVISGDTETGKGQFAAWTNARFGTTVHAIEAGSERHSFHAIAPVPILLRRASRDELVHFLQDRLDRAGMRADVLSPGVAGRIARLSDGRVGRANTIARAASRAARKRRAERIELRDVRRAGRVYPRRRVPLLARLPRRLPAFALGVCVTAAAAAVLATVFLRAPTPRATTALPPPSVASAAAGPAVTAAPAGPPDIHLGTSAAVETAIPFRPDVTPPAPPDRLQASAAAPGTPSTSAPAPDGPPVAPAPATPSPPTVTAEANPAAVAATADAKPASVVVDPGLDARAAPPLQVSLRFHGWDSRAEAEAASIGQRLEAQGIAIAPSVELRGRATGSIAYAYDEDRPAAMRVATLLGGDFGNMVPERNAHFGRRDVPGLIEVTIGPVAGHAGPRTRP